MFPADCLPTNYIEARSASSSTSSTKPSSTTSSTPKSHHLPTSTTVKPLLLQPVPKRPAGPPRTISCPPRTLSSALSNLFPASGTATTSSNLSVSAASSARTSPAGTPLPSPSLCGPSSGVGRGWFGAPSSVGISKSREDRDITCLPPAWS